MNDWEEEHTEQTPTRQAGLYGAHMSVASATCCGVACAANSWDHMHASYWLLGTTGTLPASPLTCFAVCMVLLLLMFPMRSL